VLGDHQAFFVLGIKPKKYGDWWLQKGKKEWYNGDMAEQFNSKRAFLPKKQQIKFINKILSKIPIKKAAELSNISERTIRDWRRGKFSMNLKKIQKLCKTTNTPLPKNIKTKN
jgi:transcriptional regulator with XRE-family HTH domain